MGPYFMFNKQKKTEKKESFLRSTLELGGLLLLVFLIRTFGFGLYQVPTGSMETTMLVGERFFADKFTPLFTTIKRKDIISFNEPLYPYSKNKLQRLWQQYVWGPSNWTKRVIGIPGDTIKGVIEDGKPIVYRNGKKLDEPYVNKYPLIQLWKANPLEIQAILRQQTMNLAFTGVPQETLEKVASQSLNKYEEIRSYDPNKSYKNQPFYKIAESHIIKGTDGEPLLIYPDMAMAPKQAYMKREGENYWSGSDEFQVKLGKNEYWLMGDNRRGSFDSRFFGPVNRDLIHGKIVFCILSIMPSNDYISTNQSSLSQWWDWAKSFLLIDIIAHPISFWSRIRWRRCLRLVR